MKPVVSFSKIAACVATVAAMFIASSAKAAEGSAVVKGILGTAQQSVSGTDWETLAAGSVLKPGAILQTGVGSQVDLSLGANGESVILLENTTLALAKLNLERGGIDVVFETFLDLRTGTIQGKVKKFSAASRYEVKTPHTIVGINGAEDNEFQISATGETHVMEGNAVVAYTNPSTGQVSAPVTVVEGNSLNLPTDPANPQTAAPTVSVTPPGAVVAAPAAPSFGGAPPATPPAPVVTVPDPVIFVSPNTGTHVSGNAAPGVGE